MIGPEMFGHQVGIGRLIEKCLVFEAYGKRVQVLGMPAGQPYNHTGVDTAGKESPQRYIRDQPELYGLFKKRSQPVLLPGIIQWGILRGCFRGKVIILLQL